jgi:polysaccharide pyruvyl transferase WcaK-like protein
MSERRDISIGLLWHSTNSGNLGVGALTVGNLIAARAAAAALGLTPRFKILEFEGDFGGSYVSGPDIESFQITRQSMLSPSGYWQMLGDLDCILDIGGGDSYADIYSPRRFAYVAATKELAFWRSVPLLFSPQTIGPFTRQPFKAIARHQMHRAVAVARDPQSMQAIADLAPRARAIQSIDVAFRLPYETPQKARGKRPLRVGVNASALLFLAERSFGMQVDYAALMRGFIAAVMSRGDAEVHLICHVNSRHLPGEDDGAIADQLAAEFPGAVRAPTFASPSDAKSYIAGLDFLTAGRMHACIAAFSSGVPVAPIAYSRKFSGLFGGMLNYPHMVPVTGMGTDEALNYLLDQLERRDELARDIAAGAKVVDEALANYDAELRRLFSQAATRPRRGR